MAKISLWQYSCNFFLWQKNARASDGQEGGHDAASRRGARGVDPAPLLAADERLVSALLSRRRRKIRDHST